MIVYNIVILFYNLISYVKLIYNDIKYNYVNL